MVIGVTGIIGAGKTTVSRMFQEMGASLIDADLIAHKLMLPYGPSWWAVCGHFGQGLVCQNTGEIDRIKLSALVFQDSYFLKQLNKIVHPLIMAEINRQIQWEQGAGAKLIMVDAPLLIETELYLRVEAVIVVTVTKKIQISRLINRKGGLTISEIERRGGSQLDQDGKKGYADFIIENTADLKHTRLQVELIYDSLIRKIKDSDIDFQKKIC